MELSPTFALLVIPMLLGYFLPALVAAWRLHHQTKAIVALNLLLGWTFIGWAAALIWALTVVKPPMTDRRRSSS